MTTGTNRVALSLLFVLLASLVLVSPACQSDGVQDILHEEASSYRFSLTAWHVRNLPAKLVSSIARMRTMPPPEEHKALVDDFFAVQSEIATLERQLARAIAIEGHSPLTEALEEDILEMRLEYMSLAPQVELVIEREVMHVLASQGFGVSLAGGQFIFPPVLFVFPPVLFVFQPIPTMLVASPRDRIQLLGYELLCPSMTISEFELLEEGVAEHDNLCGLVVTPGALTTYPSIVDEGARFHRTLHVMAHEWVHQYLIFYPLGRTWFRGGVYRQINETVADIIGYEAADHIYRQYGYEPPPRTPSPTETGFDYAAEIGETRLVVGQLLEEGRIEEAEQYMEQRRQLFVQEGYYIRKLNQAYFAILDQYPLHPSSVSHIGEQLEELRSYYGTLSEFVVALRQLTTHEELLALLDEMRAGQPEHCSLD